MDVLVSNVERLRVVENMDVTPLISVIAPIYNVEKYVRKCLDSLKNQTMREIEVICIDDGSTDGSGRIADEYESGEFPIFRVIHTENRGLSAARNTGIDEARADYLMFVDTDDWVDRRFCEIPYKAAIENDADLVIFKSYSVRRGRKRIPNDALAPVGIVNRLSAHEYGSVVSWNKLYKKRIFQYLSYPVGRAFEDVAIAHKIIETAEKIMLLPNRLYYHLYRTDSITHMCSVSYKKDAFVFSINRCDYLTSLGFPCEKTMPLQCASAIAYLSNANEISTDDETYMKARTVIENIEHPPKSLPLKLKAGIYIWRRNKKVFYFVSSVYRNLKRVVCKISNLWFGLFPYLKDI